jgi:thioesterase domain-containing protein
VRGHKLTQYLHTHIPLSQTIGIEVLAADFHSVTLEAPLGPNINHRETVFGGSASSVAILAAWALLYVRLQHEDLTCRIVIQRNTMNYERPITGDFSASSTIQGALAWEKFLSVLKRKGRARITVAARLFCDKEKVAEFEGDYAALRL